jgi:hypothetical protein
MLGNVGGAVARHRGRRMPRRSVGLPACTLPRCHLDRLAQFPNLSPTSYLSSRRFGRLMQAHEHYHQNTTSSSDSEAGIAGALDHVLHSKSRILRTKLEVLASEIRARFAMWDLNLDRIGNEKENVEALLDQSARLTRHHLREPNEVTRLRESSLNLDAQQRQEDIQCWRDVVLVMRDFLDTWESHKQAKNRSIFLNHAGSRTEDTL